MFRKLLPLVIGSLAAAAVILPNASALAAAPSETPANVRDATAAYRDPAAALAGGYELLTDASGLACIDMPGEGTMGIHYVKSALVQAGAIDATRPQALVYEQTTDGRLDLAAVEYVVLQAGWDSAHAAPPSLFGTQFDLTPTDNRYGLPAFYSLHAWVWTENPAGMFKMWNPSLQCAGGSSAQSPEPVVSFVPSTQSRDKD